MQRHNDQPIKDALHQWLNSYKHKGKLQQSRVQQIWSERMGTTISGHTQEVKIYGKKLFITINSASLKQELSYSREQIKEMMNTALGEDYISEVIVR